MSNHYNAFISYRHHPDDIRVASEIHRALERFHVPASIRKKYGKIERLFRDKEELPITSNLTDVNSYWRAVVVEQPIYYISYAVSVIAAIDLYTVATEDFDAAAEIYRKLCEEPDPEAGFLGNITAAGLSTPFDADFYSKLTALVKKN